MLLLDSRGGERLLFAIHSPRKLRQQKRLSPLILIETKPEQPFLFLDEYIVFENQS